MTIIELIEVLTCLLLGAYILILVFKDLYRDE